MARLLGEWFTSRGLDPADPAHVQELLRSLSEEEDEVIPKWGTRLDATLRYMCFSSVLKPFIVDVVPESRPMKGPVCRGAGPAPARVQELLRSYLT